MIWAKIYPLFRGLLLPVTDDSTLWQVMRHLQERYGSSRPDPRASFEPGQAVIAQSPEDRQFYRAIINDGIGNRFKVWKAWILVDRTYPVLWRWYFCWCVTLGSILTAQVMYVDFGNSEWVDAIHLRSDLVLCDVPIQCQRSVFDRLSL